MREIRKITCSNGEKITLRPALADDAQALIDAVRSTAEERSYVLMEAYGKDTESQKKYIEQFDRSRNLLLVAVSGTTVIGSLAGLETQRFQGVEEVRSLSLGIHIVRECRGRGVGAALLRYAIQWAKEHGYKRLEADIFTTNKRSLNLFSKSGFREESCKVRKIRVGNQQIHEVILTKKL